MGDYARHHNYTVDLNKPLQRHFCGVLLASDDREADDFIFTVKRDGVTYRPGVFPIMYGYFVRSDGVTVRIEGTSLSGNGVMSVTLPKECYVCEGRFTLTAKLTNLPDNVTTVAIIDGYIRKTSTNDIEYPDGEEESGGVSWATVPDYWQSHIDERVNDTNTAMAAATGGRSAFLFYSDAHWTWNFQQSPALLKYLCMNTPIKQVFFGGDLVDSENDMAYLSEWRKAVSELPCHHSVAGNHDDGDTVENRWDDAYVYDFLLAGEETDDVVNGGGKLYYYKDVQSERTRYLFLDTATYDGMIQKDTVQQEWLKQTLLSTPHAWNVVAVSHIWRNHSNEYGDLGWSASGQICLDMFDAYNAREGDFASCTGHVRFCVGGHLHFDADYVSDGGIPVILVDSDCISTRSGLECTEDTISENSVNAIVADYTAGTINVIRIGRGNSRIVQLDGSGSEEIPDAGDTPDYDLVAPTGNFTNVIKTATEADGTTPYNSGHGYKNDVRIQYSTMSEIDAAGWDMTGYIPAKVNDVIRFHGMEFMDMDGSAGTPRCCLWLYKEDFSYLTNSSNFAPDSLSEASAWEAVYGDDGNIVQIKLTSSMAWNVAYFRICAHNITGASIITVNEEINITE